MYHQLTGGENGGVDPTKGIAFSRDGSLALYDENVTGGYAATVVGGDGSGKKLVDTVSAGWIDMNAVSGDGSLVAYAADSLLISSVASPARITVPGVSQGRSWSRFARDPADATRWRIYFAMNAAWGSPSREPGVYSAASDGTGVVELMSPAQAAALAGGGLTAATISPKGGRYSFDVSADGKIFVAIWWAGSCTSSGEKDYVLGGATDGSSSKVLLGPVTAGCGVEKIALSGDGSTVAFDVDNAADTSKRDIGVVTSGGGNQATLATIVGGNDNNWGITDDGASVVAGYRLIPASGTGAFDLSLTGETFSSDPPSGIDLELGTPDGKGDRIVYVDTGASPRRMGALEINPASMRAAPTISAPALSPATIPADGSASAKVTVKITSPGAKPAHVGAAALLAGTHDNLEIGDFSLYDDGTHGDATAGDGVYTYDQIKALSGAKSGARTLRVRATVVDPSGKSHSTAVDFGTLTVQ